MKELSIEEKAKRYDEALGKARRYYDEYKTRDNILYVEDMEDMFPELKESEDDDEIRKDILNYIKHNYDGQHISISRYDSWIAWLERQCKPQIRTGLEWVNTIDDACDKRYSEEYAHGEYCHEQSFKWGFQEGVDWLEKQSEQKPADTEKGTNGNERKTSIPEPPLTIKHAKEVMGIKQDYAWSEEDEKCIENAIMYCEWARDIAPNLHCYETTEKSINWLKSIKGRAKPQSTWKPSDEQMDAIDYVKNFDYGGYKDMLVSLYYDLKKLREE